MGRGRQCPAELLVEHDALHRGHARPAVLLGQLEPDQVEMGQLLPQIGRVADRVVLQLAHHRTTGWWWRTRPAPSPAASPARAEFAGPTWSMLLFGSRGRSGTRRRPVTASTGPPSLPRVVVFGRSGSATWAWHVVLASPSTDTDDVDGRPSRTRCRRRPNRRPPPGTPWCPRGRSSRACGRSSGAGGRRGRSSRSRYRSNQAAWLGVLRKMSRVPLRSTAKSLSWCMGRQSRDGQGAEHHRGGGHRVGQLGQHVATATSPCNRRPTVAVMAPPPARPGPARR